MKKKGFTLVELLAVIVILAIIALIATPMILNVINNAKKGAAESSAYGYIDAIEKSILEEELNGIARDKNKVYSVSDLTFVNVKGDKPTEGWVSLEKGAVVDYSLKIGNYIVNNENETAKAEKGDTLKEPPGGTTEAAICTAATTKSIDSALLASDGEPYAYGVEYNCDPGDGTIRTFFVLEDGDNTTLKKGNTGSAGTNEVSLIMNSNIDDEKIPYNSTNSNVEMQELKTKLETVITSWNAVTVTIPTGYQIASVMGDSEWSESASSANNEKLKPLTWLYDYLYGSVHPISEIPGYWTSTPYTSSSNTVWVINNGGYLTNLNASADYSQGSGAGLRPVITLSKNDLKY